MPGNRSVRQLAHTTRRHLNYRRLRPAGSLEDSVPIASPVRVYTQFIHDLNDMAFSLYPQ